MMKPFLFSLYAVASVLLAPQVVPTAAARQGVSGAVVSEYSWQGETARHAYDPAERVRRVVVFAAPPLALAGRDGAGKALAAAGAVIEAEHARFLADVARLDGAAKAGGTQIVRDYRTALNGVAVTTSRGVAGRLAALPYVKGVYEDFVVNAHDDASDRVIGADRVRRELGLGGRGVVVAIIDTGVDYTHEALGGGIGPGFKVIGGYDFVDDDEDPMDAHSHGTHVAGIVAGSHVAGFGGVAPEASLLAYRVLDENGSGYASDIIAAVEHALDPDGNPATDDAADVLNLSLGGEGHPDDPGAQAIDNATAAGVVCVVAAGNNGRSFGVDSPGAARSALTVGASNNADVLADFSSRGPVATSFDNKPDVLAPGVAIMSSVPGGYAVFSGTSMATPHVAGAVALLLERHPGWSPAVVKAALMLSTKDTGRHLWEQGTGRIDVPAAAAMTAVVLPASLGFGNLDPNQSTTTFERLLTVRNLGTAAQTFTATASHAIAGAVVEVRPSSVAVPAGGAATLMVTARFSSGALAFPTQIDIPYMGQVLVTGGGQTLRVPFSVTKTPQLVLRYDEPPAMVMILSDQGGIERTFNPSDVVSFALPQGTYDVFSEYRVPHGDAYTLGVLFTERVAVTGKQELRLSRVDVRHAVTFEPLGPDGRVLPAAYTSVHVNLGGSFDMLTSLPIPVVYTSTTGTRLRLEAVMRSLPTRDGTGDGVEYVVPLAHYAGVAGAVTVRNDPAAFREVRSLFRPPPGVTELFAVPMTYKQIGTFLLTSDSWYAEVHADRHRLGPPFERTVRYAPNPSGAFGYPYQAYMVYNTSGGALPVMFGEGANLVAVTPPLRVTSEAVEVYAHADFSSPVQSVRAGVLEERFGAAPFSMQARMWNVPSMIRFDQKHRLGLFFGTGGDVLAGPVAYRLLRGGLPVREGVLASDVNIRDPFVEEPGPYELRLAFDGGYVDDRPARADVRLAFDTQVPSGQLYDPDPPYLDGLTLTSAGSLVEALDPSAPGAVVAVVRDTYNAGGPQARPVASAELAVRRLGETAWMALPAVRQGEVFTAAWPPEAAPGYYALRLDAKDAAGNTLEYRAEPAFRAGALAGNRAPEAARLVAPAPGFEIDLDSLVAPVAFRWQAAADPDAGQVVRYVFRLAGPGLDTTLATSETALALDLRGRLDHGSTYTWRVETTDGFVFTAPEAPGVFTTTAFGVGTDPGEPGLPRAFVLEQNYPNPFNPRTMIRFGLPAASNARVEVHDALGRRVALLADGAFSPGYHTLSWDAADLPSGVYFLSIHTPAARHTRAMTLLR